MRSASPPLHERLSEFIRAARDMLPNHENSITSIAKLLGVSPGTLYNPIPDLQELPASGQWMTTHSTSFWGWSAA